MYSIGVDIGGMSVKVGIVDTAGRVLDKTSFKTIMDADACIKRLAKTIENILETNKISKSQVRGVGIGVPGAVASGVGVIDILPNLGWIKVNLKEELMKLISLPVYVSNDANVAILAEVMYGSAKGYNNAIMFTLGTGVGGGIVIDGKLYEGYLGRGAELGHTTLIIDGKPCTCGRKGCVEAYISATALIDQTKEMMKAHKDSKMWNETDNDIEKVDGKTAFTCEALGDEPAKKVVDKYIMYLSESIMNMLNVFRPEVFILGGGISHQGENLIKRVVCYLEKFEYGYKFAPKTKIVTATLKNDAGIIGASALI